MLIKRMEKKVNVLIEESAHANIMGDYQTVSVTYAMYIMPYVISMRGLEDENVKETSEF